MQLKSFDLSRIFYQSISYGHLSEMFEDLEVPRPNIVVLDDFCFPSSVKKVEQEGAKKERNAPTLPKQYLDGRLGASQRWQIHNQNPPVHKESVKFGQFLTKMSPSDLDPLFAHNTGEFQEPPTM